MAENENKTTSSDSVLADNIKSVSQDVKNLDRKLTEFQASVQETNSRFGARIGALEGHNLVQDERMEHVKERIDEISSDIAQAQRDQKAAIADLKSDTKESLDDLKRGNQKILEALSPMQYKVDHIDEIEADVEKIKQKSGETWEHIKKSAIGWIVAAILALVAFATGLSHFI